MARVLRGGGFRALTQHLAARAPSSTCRLPPHRRPARQPALAAPRVRIRPAAVGGCGGWVGFGSSWPVAQRCARRRLHTGFFLASRRPRRAPSPLLYLPREGRRAPRRAERAAAPPAVQRPRSHSPAAGTAAAAAAGAGGRAGRRRPAEPRLDFVGARRRAGPRGGGPTPALPAALFDCEIEGDACLPACLSGARPLAHAACAWAGGALGAVVASSPGPAPASLADARLLPGALMHCTAAGGQPHRRICDGDMIRSPHTCALTICLPAPPHPACPA